MSGIAAPRWHIEPCDARSEDAAALMDELNALLAALSGDSGAARFDPSQMQSTGCAFLLARDGQGQAQGCGALRPLPEGPPGTAEIKRMYARARGQGLGAALLAALLDEARRLGYRRVWLETRRVNASALAFYQQQGFTEIPGYGHYAGRTDAACLALPL